VPIERAEIAALAAALAGDQESRGRALAELAALTPADVQLPRALAQLEFAAWRLEPAVAWYRRALAIEPESGELWNMLAYAEAQRGAFDAARKSISEYARLAPENPNAPDSAGDIDFLAGDFAGAERGFLAASRMNATWAGGGPLLKAAHARAMTGDVAGADGLFLRYLELRRTLKDPVPAYRQAQWEFVTGRRRQAMERLDSFRAASGGETAAHAAAQLAVWKRQTGDRAGARQLALEAAKLASAPATRRLAAVVLLATEPPAPAGEWAVRAERVFGGQPSDAVMKEHALAYALLLEGYYREASVLLKRMILRTPPAAAGDLRILAAWALIESGQIKEARPFARLYPLPEAQGEPAFGSLTMPRVLLIRSRLAAQDEAARLRTAYEKLKGDVADAIGGN
jgi:tetratricopeptide (TPR) repeat protein